MRRIQKPSASGSLDAQIDKAARAIAEKHHEALRAEMDALARKCDRLTLDLKIERERRERLEKILDRYLTSKRANISE